MWARIFFSGPKNHRKLEYCIVCEMRRKRVSASEMCVYTHRIEKGIFLIIDALVWCVSMRLRAYHYSMCVCVWIRILSKIYMYKRPNASGWMMHIIILLIDSEYCKYTFYIVCVYMCVCVSIMYYVELIAFFLVTNFDWNNLFVIRCIPFGFLFFPKSCLNSDGNKFISCVRFFQLE